jgi:ectoine hydroxylase-related dioxygenase (phytanoyl-CoA dioxygenase family)
MSMQVDDNFVARFERDGFIIVDRILDAGAVEIARRALDRVRAGHYVGDRRPPAMRSATHPTFGGDRTTHWIVNGRLLDEQLWSLVTASELGQAAARLLRTSRVSVIEDQLLDKPPGGAPLATHQDYRYWQFSTSTRMLTCWIALDDMSRDNGTVEMVPGSHRWGEYVADRGLADDFRDSVDGASIYLRVADALRPADVSLELVPVVVPAGGGVFFHSLTIHSSGANATAHRRRAVSIHYASEECRIILGKTVEQAFPYCFARLKDGDRLVNKYLPEVYSAGG